MRILAVALWLVALALATTTVTFLVAVFVFGFQAALTPGPNPEQFDAAFLSAIGVLVSAALTVLLTMFAAVTQDEVS